MKQAFKVYSNLIFLSAILLNACSGSKELRKTNHAISGDWVLQTIVMEGTTGKPKEIFNEADFGCFIGSDWRFNRNGNGSYTIVDQQKSCPAVTRRISWVLVETQHTPLTCVLKRYDDKDTPMDNNGSFSLIVDRFEGATMKLKSDVTIDGHPAAIIYNFKKAVNKL